MSRLQTSFVLGYHGCEEDLGRRVIAGDADLLASEGKTDWLGTGIYFWESDPKRALEWAASRKGPRKLKAPFVVGAVIELRNCLDLMARNDLELVRNAFLLFEKTQQAAGVPLPQNTTAPSDKSRDKVLRALDCAVIDYLHSFIKQEGQEHHDTVRGLFPEGKYLFKGSGIRSKNHSQIAVRNNDCIKGYFLPRLST